MKTQKTKSAFISSLVFRFYFIAGDAIRLLKGILSCLVGILLTVFSFYYFIVILNDVIGIYCFIPVILINILYGYFITKFIPSNSIFDKIQYKLNY